MGTREVLLELRESQISPEGGPLHICGTGETKNLEFGMHIDHQRY